MVLLVITLIISFIVFPGFEKSLNAQTAYGDRQFRRIGVHNGNQVATIFFNQGDVSGWEGWGFPPPRAEWPKGSGHEYSGENSILVATEVVDENGQTIHIVSESSLDFDSTDEDAEGFQLGWEPLPGYFNPFQDSPAMSHMPVSWPDFWPDKLDQDDSGWPGAWNGFFGKGVTQADQESYFVMDDNANTEFAFSPDANDSKRSGLGLLVKSRGLQWSHILAEDAIFWLYDITNIGTHNYKKVVFGEIFDSFIGGFGDENDDSALFDPTGDLDITYSWDDDGIGVGGFQTGYFGYAFLESPGNGNDGKDNDEDGLFDETRDSGPGTFIFGPIGTYGADNWHWSGDEDGDWLGFIDQNGNEQWDTEDNNGNGILDDDEDENGNGILDYEILNDDLGRDGIGPESSDYTGADPGEGDNIPTDGEPHFDKTDVDESDQIGLTSMESHAENSVFLKDDESIWGLMRPGRFAEIAQRTNTEFIYGSGYFPLDAGRTERFSLATVFGENFDDILRNKQTVQQIYNSNYNFSKPPLVPTLTAVAGDHRVTLYWDRKAETSFDPVYGRDFEGYVIYRSTDPGFLEAKTITDSKGIKSYRKPIAQFDKINGLTGPHPISVGEEVGFPSGANYYLGDDTGLQITFVDSGQTWAGNLENGQRYYYAIVSYDRGYAPGFFERGLSPKALLQPISPTECTSIIEADATGKIVFTDINTAVVTPNAPAAGYIAPEIEAIDRTFSSGSGRISLKVLNPLKVKDSHSYSIGFEEDSLFGTSYTIKDVSESPAELILLSDFMSGEENAIFDGLLFQVWNDTMVVFDSASTGWTESNSNYTIDVRLNSNISPPPNRIIAYPADYEIRFGEVGIDTALYFAPIGPDIAVPFSIWNLTDTVQANFIVLDQDNNGEWSSGDRIYIVGGNSFPEYHPVYWMITIAVPDDSTITPIPPENNDVAVVKIIKPFRSGDKITFSTVSSQVDKAIASSSLDKVAVVPDPYVAAASWEPRQFLSAGSRGERKIDFIHLPPKCIIRIFTIRGELVQTIEHDKLITDGSESWNLRSKDGLDIAYGIYIFHIKAPGIGEKAGRFAIIK